MNLFLLFAVPLAAVVLQRLFYASRPLAEPKSWILGSIWSILSLIVVTPFGKWREFDGSLWGAGLGLTLTDAFLVPGGVIAAWFFTRPKRDSWELSLWLVLVFTMAGIRDFAATSRTYDLNEYFLVPLQRLLVIIALPTALSLAIKATKTQPLMLWWTAAALLVLTAPLFQVLSFAGWGWVVWPLESAAIGLTIWAIRPARL